MKKFISFSALVFTGLLFFCAITASAQVANLNAQMLKFFAEYKGFTADVETSIVDPASKATIFAPTTMFQLDGKIRMESDMEKIKNYPFPAGTLEQLKSFKMTRCFNVIDPEKKTITFIFPDLSAYFAIPLTDEQANDFKSEAKKTKTELGKETVDGHPCVKNKVVITDAAGSKQEVLTWNATDLNTFPIKIQTTTPQGETTAIYKNVKIEKPDAALFSAPAGYTSYASQIELIQKAQANVKP